VTIHGSTIKGNMICCQLRHKDTNYFVLSKQCWEVLHPSYSNEPVLRLDHQLLLKSPPLTLLAGSAPAFSLY